MPTIDLDKTYYSMGEASILTEISPSVIRFYEKEFSMNILKNNKNNFRYFSQEDIETLKLIVHLTRDKGHTLQGAKEYMKSQGSAGKNDLRVIDSLENIKKFLIEVRDQL